MAYQKLKEELERDARGCRTDYIDREILLDMLDRNDVDGFRDTLYRMDTCQGDSVYEMVKNYSTEFYEKLGEL